MTTTTKLTTTPRKILLIRLSALGDVLLATPAARLLAERFPSSRIDWLVEAPYLPLLMGNPHVQPIAYNKRGADSGLSGLRSLERRIAHEGYDLVVDLQNKPKTALWRSGISEAVVFRKRTFFQGLCSLFGNALLPDHAHATALFVEALTPLGIEVPQAPEALFPELHLTDAMREEAKDVAPSSRMPHRPLVGIAPGTRWATKCWPIQSFATLAKFLNARGADLLLIGGPDDAAAFAAIRAALPQGVTCRDTASLSVGGLAAAIDHCALVVSGDSGPAHIAAALGIATLTLFGPTSPNRWAPRGPRASHLCLGLACSPCSNHGARQCPIGTHACLTDLGVEMVLERAEALLNL
ncbi:MAG: glycosyltransferase family 9 protein [Myxococcales bacterium]|nr:glycosyltransferase family 9 protein [Myxococcales bacterium]